MKRSKLSRMLQIVVELQSSRNIRVDDLVEMHKLSRRTIFCDLNELRMIGILCRYDAKTGTYSINPDFSLPPINLNRKEVISLPLLAYKAKIYIKCRSRAQLCLQQ
jgi:predicted DNA-binding transcriptional regulator YafY